MPRVEEYRSGRNGPDSKSGWVKAHVGSNPTSSACKRDALCVALFVLLCCGLAASRRLRLSAPALRRAGDGRPATHWGAGAATWAEAPHGRRAQLGRTRRERTVRFRKSHEGRRRRGGSQPSARRPRSRIAARCRARPGRRAGKPGDRPIGRAELQAGRTVHGAAPDRPALKAAASCRRL